VPYAPEGNVKTAKYIFIGEAPAKNELLKGHPFAGPSGFVFDECIGKAGISRAQCYLTNVWDFMVKKSKDKTKFFDDRGEMLWSNAGFTQHGWDTGVTRLLAELEPATANVIIPMGNPAMLALLGKKKIMKQRGSILWSDRLNKKCIPTIHPANAIHGMYVNRYLIVADMKKARRQAAFPEIQDLGYKFNLNPTFSQCVEVLEGIKQNKTPHSEDIEVAHRQVSMISFGIDRYLSHTIPFGAGNWSLEQERELWLLFAAIAEDEEIPKIFQNGCFDIQFLWMIHNVLVRGKIDDTMTAHHIIYPDFLKGLDFFCSLHTDQPYYKDMVKHGAIDKADG